MARSAWIVPLAIFSLLFILFLIAATIVLALIPVYLSTRNIVANETTYDTIAAAYASNLAGGDSLTLANTASVSTQLVNNAGLSSNTVDFESGSFASTTAANGRKRQISNGNPTCERATGLTGSIFVVQYRVKHPETCLSTNCRQQYTTKALNDLRMGYRTITILMNFTNGETRNVSLVFCAQLNSNYNKSAGCTTETKNNIYLFDVNSVLYQFTPATLALTAIGQINCSPSGVYAMSIQRNGIIWAIFQDGTLYNYNIYSQQCTLTSYVANQDGTTIFVMAFVSNGIDNSETLYISKANGPDNTLAIMDLTTLTLSDVGNYSNSQQIQDLAGTNENILFGVLENTSNYTIAKINPTNANIMAQYSLGISPSVFYYYGFAAYDSNIFFFAGNGSAFSTLYRLDTLTGTTMMLENYSIGVADATASTCLGTS